MFVTDLLQLCCSSVAVVLMKDLTELLGSPTLVFLYCYRAISLSDTTGPSNQTKPPACLTKLSLPVSSLLTERQVTVCLPWTLEEETGEEQDKEDDEGVTDENEI